MRKILFPVMLLSLLMVIAPITGAQEDRLQVVGSHSILSDVIANVAGDVADVTSMMPRGADPHSFQPTPGDLTALADADVVFINGAFFEEGLLEAIENADDDMKHRGQLHPVHRLSLLGVMLTNMSTRKAKNTTKLMKMAMSMSTKNMKAT